MNLPPIREKWLEAKANKIKQYPQNVLRASSIGKPCDRFHYHSIKDWKERSLHEPILQSIFDEGNLHEDDVIRQLKEVGFTIIEQQRSFQYEKPKITGHIDGILRWDGHDFPFDVKSISSFDFPKINSAEDLLYSKKAHQREYMAQIQMYLLMSGNEVGCFILKNKQTGEIKPIWCQLDVAFCEPILKRAERVYHALDKDTLPERTKESDLCHQCAFKHVCLPDLTYDSNLKQINSQELAATFERMDQLKPIVSEYKNLEEEVDEVKKQVGVGEFVCGDFLLRIKEFKKKNKVALTWTEEETTFLKKEIVKIKENKGPLKMAA